MTTPTTPNRQKSLAGMYLYTAVWGGITLYFGFQELRYSLFAATATATVTHKSQETRSNGKGGGTHQVLVLDYSFRDANGAQRSERDEVPLGWGNNGTVPIEYIPGAIGSSRVKGAKSQGGLLLITGLFAAIGGVIVWLKSVSNAKASEPLEPLVSCATVDIANEARAESSDVRVDRKRDRQRRESNSPMHSPAVPIELGGPGWHRRESGVPMFASDSLVCRYAGWMGKPVSVIVDHSAGMIHFQNCLRLRKFWAISSEPWFSCPFSSLVAAHDFTHKGQRGLTIVTRSGTARIPSEASSFESLCQTLPAVIPGGGRAFSTEHPAFGILLAFGAMGGFVLGFALTPKGASDATLWLMMLGSAFAVLMTLLGGARLLSRP